MPTAAPLTRLLIFFLCAAGLFFAGCASAPPAGQVPRPDNGHGPLEVVARVMQPPGNLTVSADGRIFISLHQHFETDLRMGEVVEGGAVVPFPNAAWNDVNRPDGQRLDSVLGVQYDTEGILWMLDNGMRSGVTPKLVGWDLSEDALHQVIELPGPVTDDSSFLNDLAVDRDRDHIYIADPTRSGHPAIIVVHLPSGSARRVLEGHKSVSAEDMDLVINQQPARIRRPDGSTFRPRLGINPIALDTENEWLYYGPMFGTGMYRVRAADLANARLSAALLGEKVERFGNKPISDGSSVNAAGQVYVSDIANNAIGLVDPGGSYVQLFQDDELILWPDSFSFGPDDFCYVLMNQLHLGPVLNAGQDATEPPYIIGRFKVESGGVVGR